VSEYWNLDDSFPTPKLMPFCPTCGRNEVIIRHWFHHCRPKSPQPCRCDVGFKCKHCAMIWYHGVKIDGRHFLGHGNVYNHRKEALMIAHNPVDRGHD